MKKVLFATTALVAFAGAASAEIAISGSAEMGFVGGGDNGIGFSNAGEVELHNDVTLTIRATGETDTGLSFGASFDFSKSPEGDENGDIVLDNEAAFISGAFGTLTMGEIDSAMDWAITETVGNPGTIGDDETIHAGYHGAFGDGAYDNQHVRYDYSMGDFGFALSAELDDSGVRDAGYAVGLRYNTTFGATAVGFGIAYQNIDAAGYAPGNLGATGYALPGVSFVGDTDIVAVSANADFGNGFVAGLSYSDWSSAALDADQTQVSLGYTTGALSIGVNYGIWDFPTGDIEGFGLAAAYDLGGGMTVLAGYGDSSWDAAYGSDDGMETFSLGVSMAF
ncbi:MAG: porin [Rhodobacteraceae bacterium]|nr:porin [Paracoccaceae bacterium]